MGRVMNQLPLFGGKSRLTIGALLVCYLLACVASQQIAAPITSSPTISSSPVASPVTPPTTNPVSLAPIEAPQEIVPIAPPIPTCPLNCSNNGICNNQTLICSCVASWAGSACQYPIVPLKLNTLVNGALIQTPPGSSATWNYYAVPVVSGNFLRATVTPAACTLNLYASFSQVPYQTSYLAAIQASITAATLSYNNPLFGSWTFGLASTSNCSYSLNITTQYSCPNNCSGHGSCNTNTGSCNCALGYTSVSDCSQAIFVANTSPPSGTVAPNSWIYYQFNSHSNEVSIQLTVTSSGGSLPANALTGFVRSGSLPTQFSYQSFCTVSAINVSCSIDLTNPTPGQWFFGIWSNYTQALPYTIAITTPTVCPNQCSRIGTCTSMGTCQCPEFYTNIDCSVYQRLMLPNVAPTYPISINASQTHYFTYTSTGRSNDMSFNLNHTQSSPPIALAIYASCGGVPTPYNFDHYETCELSSTSVCALVILKSPACRWMFAVQAKSALPHLSSNFTYIDDSYAKAVSSQDSFMPLATSIQYTVSLVTQIVCPNSCSGHGACQATGDCFCNINYQTLADCSRFVLPMADGMQVNGVSILPGEWAYFFIYADMDNYLSFTITGLSGGKIDAYLGNTDLPTPLSYYRSITRGNQTMYQLSATAGSTQLNGTWTLGVFGDDTIPTVLNVEAHADRDCPDHCFGNGVCSSTGQCICKPGYVTSDCSALSVLLPSNLEVQGTVRFDTWNYYNLTVLGDDALEIVVQENENWIVGLVWVFVARNRVPTVEDHDYSNQTETTTIHTIPIPSGETRGLWMIGVTGSPRATGSSYLRRARYNLFALSGCGTYTGCDTCVLDPNCGWCRNQPFDPNAGLCVPGNDQTSLNQTCLFYQYSTCSLGDDMDFALTKGLVIGVVVGLIILLAGGLCAFLVYRYWKHWEKAGLKPIHLYPEEGFRFGVGSSSPPPVPSSSSPQPQSHGENGSSSISGAASLVAVFNLTLNASSTDMHEQSHSADVESSLTNAEQIPSSTTNYGTMSADQPLLSDDSQSGVPSQGIYYSFGGADPYTDDSGSEHGDYSSDSEQDKDDH